MGDCRDKECWVLAEWNAYWAAVYALESRWVEGFQFLNRAHALMEMLAVALVRICCRVIIEAYFCCITKVL